MVELNKVHIIKKEKKRKMYTRTQGTSNIAVCLMLTFPILLSESWEYLSEQLLFVNSYSSDSKGISLGCTTACTVLRHHMYTDNTCKLIFLEII